MKHFVLNPTKTNTPRFRAWYDYLIDLDNQIWSLYDYLAFINPNYIVLNESDVEVKDSGVYYSNAELEKLHLIQPVYFEIQPEEEYYKGIIIFPSHLPFHWGIVNNFSEYHKDYTILCWFSYDDVFNAESGWGMFGTRFITEDIRAGGQSAGKILVPANSWVVNYESFIEYGRLMTGFGLTDVDNTNYKITLSEDLFNIRLVDVDAQPNSDGEYNVSDVVYLTRHQLRMVSGKDVIWSVDGIPFEPQPVENTGASPIMVFPEAYTILSLITPSTGVNDGCNVEKQKPENFFLGSLSASAAIYRIISSVTTSDSYQSSWQYYPPDDATGSDLLFNFTPPRSYLKRTLTNWNDLTGSANSFQQISTNLANNNRLIYIGNGLSVNNQTRSQVWTQFDPLNSEFVMMSDSDSNTINIEPIEVQFEEQKTSTTNLAGEGVAMYTINVKNYQASLFNNIKWFLW